MASKSINITTSKRKVSINQGDVRLWILGGGAYHIGRELTEIECELAAEIFRLRAEVERLAPSRIDGSDRT